MDSNQRRRHHKAAGIDRYHTDTISGGGRIRTLGSSRSHLISNQVPSTELGHPSAKQKADP